MSPFEAGYLAASQGKPRKPPYGGQKGREWLEGYDSYFET